MKLTATVLASALVLASTCAFAHTVRHKSNVRSHTAASSVVLRPQYRNQNGNAQGRFHPTPPPTQSFDDPEGKRSGLPL